MLQTRWQCPGFAESGKLDLYGCIRVNGGTDVVYFDASDTQSAVIYESKVAIKQTIDWMKGRPQEAGHSPRSCRLGQHKTRPSWTCCE